MYTRYLVPINARTGYSRYDPPGAAGSRLLYLTMDASTIIVSSIHKFILIRKYKIVKERVRPPAVHPRFRCFPRVFLAKRLDLKSHRPTRDDRRRRSSDHVSEPFLTENLLLKYKNTIQFEQSYGGTPEPQTAQDAPWLHGPSSSLCNIKNIFVVRWIK